MKCRLSILIIALAASFISCERIKRKGHQVVDKTKEKLENTKDKIIDKVFSPSEPTKPDTLKNKRLFREMLKVEVTDDVKNIFTNHDMFGIDEKVLISFNCDSTTINNIVEVKGMTISTRDDDNGLLFSGEFPWWDKKAIEKIKPYKVGKENEYWNYLWYDKKTKTAYFEMFSL